MRPEAFKLVADTPLTCPRTKIAVLKHKYSQKTVMGFCPLPDKGKISMMMAKEETRQLIESCLNYFHQDLSSVVAELSAFDTAKFLGNVDRSLVGAMYATAAYRTWRPPSSTSLAHGS